MPKKRGGGQSSHGKLKAGPHGRFIRSNNKRRGRGRGRGGHQNGGHRGAMPELMDLEQNIYVPDASGGDRSMKSMSRRPGRLVDEIKYTSSHQDQTLGKQLRNRPIEFVKAKEVYDPNSVLFSKAGKEGEEDKSVDVEGEQQITTKEVYHEVTLGSPAEEKLSTPEEILVPETSSSSDGGTEEQDEDQGGEEEQSTPEVLDFMIDETRAKIDESIAIPSTSTISSKGTEKGAEYDSVLNIGKMSLNTYKDENNESYVELGNFKKKSRGFESYAIPIDSSDDSSSLYDDYIQNMRDQDISSEEEEEEINNYVYEGFNKLDEEIVSVRENSAKLKEEEISEPSYGFVPEDFEFDVSKVSISNIRYGISNAYHVLCAELTSSDEHVWVDEKDLFDYLLSSGVKEHRLSSFMKYVAGHLVHEDTVEEETDVYISDSLDEDEGSESSEVDDDNLDDLVSFSKSNKVFTDDNRPATQSRRVKGKGANQELDLDHLNLEADIFEALQSQYSNHRMAKRNKKEKRDIEAELKAIKKHDLLTIYPYSLHVREMINELESFLHDASRYDLNFPPLDPHGNKTVTKLATCFNFKSSKNGDGRKAFIRVSKGKKTFRYLPRYEQIYAISRQRPIFNRTDQRRPKGEITETDGNSQKDSRKGRNKDTNKAHLKEGDIVGGQAPEIDPENIGRKLLERLGWVKGEGLGIHGNKGISEPVVAKVKKSKTGIK